MQPIAFVRSRGSVLAHKVRRRLGLGSEIELVCGPRMRVASSQPSWQRVSSMGWYELDTELFMTAFLRQGDVVFDVGAHVGVLTVLSSILVGQSGQVHAFEPDAAALSELEQAVALNRRDNVVVNRKAVSDSDAGIFFAKSTQAYDKQMPAPESTGAVRNVPSTTLDGYCQRANVSNVDLVKVDVDGPELLALRGARDLVEGDSPPALVIEVSDETRRVGYAPEEILTFVQERGYEVFGSRMKFPRILPIRRAADFRALPVKFERGDVANIFCLKPEAHRERLTQRLQVDVGSQPSLEQLASQVWPDDLIPPSYHRHFLNSPSRFRTQASFWHAYQRELDGRQVRRRPSTP